jgi:hypothetical protein
MFRINGKAATRNFHEWRSYFAQKNQALFNLFLSTVANQCYWLAEDADPITQTGSCLSIASAIHPS